jgi:hypothetical protein
MALILARGEPRDPGLLAVDIGRYTARDGAGPRLFGGRLERAAGAARHALAAP